MITFREYVAEQLQQIQDGMITEEEMLRNIETAGQGKISSVKIPEAEMPDGQE